jgi:hypothetical protein
MLESIIASKGSKKIGNRGFKSSFIQKILQFDSFGVPKHVNINGETKIKSIPGSLISFCLYAILMIYGIKKLFKSNLPLKPK